MADNKVNSGLLEFNEDQKVFVALDAETGEVKKAVTIDGDGVETDITGEDVTVEALSVTENGTYSEEGKAYSPVTVEVESDFSTANITLVASGQFIADLLVVAIVGDALFLSNNPPVGTFPTVLYKGAGIASYNGAALNKITVSGNATINEMGVITITGDCTITMAD